MKIYQRKKEGHRYITTCPFCNNPNGFAKEKAELTVTKTPPGKRDRYLVKGYDWYCDVFRRGKKVLVHFPGEDKCYITPRSYFDVPKEIIERLNPNQYEVE